MVVEVEGFFGVYLLYSVNPKFRGRTYVGFTVNPERRVRQHNAGRKRGGAWRTSGRGPWDMVLIVHGFPTDIAALRFEWAWQHPHRSRRLCHVTRRRRSESSLVFHVRVLAEMVRTLPWQRLPLTIRWLKQDYRMDFPPGLQPPLHMPIAFGPVRARTAHIQLEAIAQKNPPSQPCSICQKPFEDEEDVITCFQPACLLSYHIICLAKEFLHNEPDQLLPNEGICPSCKTSVLWGDLVRYKNGCYGDLEEMGASAQHLLNPNQSPYTVQERGWQDGREVLTLSSKLSSRCLNLSPAMNRHSWYFTGTLDR